MDKILILYKSKYGATKEYVDMLCQEFDCDVSDAKSFRQVDLDNYNWVIFAGGLYANSMAGLDILEKNFSMFENKNLALFCVGASPCNEKSCLEIRHHNLRGNLKNLPMFYGRGRWNEDILNLKDRFFIGSLRKFIDKKPTDSVPAWLQDLLNSDHITSDWIDRAYLTPLIKYIKLKNANKKYNN